MRSAFSFPCLLGCLALCLGESNAWAAAGKSAKAERAVLQARPDDERMLLECGFRTWDLLLEWVSDNTKMPLVTGAALPEGAVWIGLPATPEYEGVRVSTLETIDYLNERLRPFALLLIRRDGCLTVVSSDTAVDPRFLPYVSPAELFQRGRSEKVRLILPLESARPVDVAGRLNTLLGPQSSVTPLQSTRGLLLIGPAGELQRAVELVLFLDR